MDCTGSFRYYPRIVVAHRLCEQMKGLRTVAHGVWVRSAAEATPFSYGQELRCTSTTGDT
ncbi:hypothetical protein ARTHRO8AJ_210017 [Arthrobacter sp. 8AJ]|nr:hypothetical protein ARTHRO8AJ_210017 [Arthrobacter sp. 8AJ]